jgi:hypothetical protein
MIRKLISREHALEENPRQAEYLEPSSPIARENSYHEPDAGKPSSAMRSPAFQPKYFIETVELWIRNANAGEQVWMCLSILTASSPSTIRTATTSAIRFSASSEKRFDSLSDDRTLIARLGGDEFGVACLRASDESIHPDPFHFRPIGVIGTGWAIHRKRGPDIGVAVWPSDAKSRSDLMRHAISRCISRKTGGLTAFLF